MWLASRPGFSGVNGGRQQPHVTGGFPLVARAPLLPPRCQPTAGLAGLGRRAAAGCSQSRTISPTRDRPITKPALAAIAKTPLCAGGHQDCILHPAISVTQDFFFARPALCGPTPIGSLIPWWLVACCVLLLLLLRCVPRVQGIACFLAASPLPHRHRRNG